MYFLYLSFITENKILPQSSSELLQFYTYQLYPSLKGNELLVELDEAHYYIEEFFNVESRLKRLEKYFQLKLGYICYNPNELIKLYKKIEVI